MPPKDLPIIKPFNPLDKSNLGESVADAVMHTHVYPLPPEPFIGAGVYVLYYTGDNPLYQKLAEGNRDGQFLRPIYIGKAVPAGARKGGQGMEVDHGPALAKRLSEHAESIRAAENLELEDFYCRFLVVDDIWIPLAESLMIERFRPVWNSVLDGFGNHDPGRGRLSGRMPNWDCVHPGREWARRLMPATATREELEARVVAFIDDMFDNH